ncbi:MAG: TolC family protein [Acidobacteria bacterium]|nr:TolC family protein [Acidobacteriota bacterium]MCA1618425.1 TolC family protein [Acidobacteriota bacterium]
MKFALGVSSAAVALGLALSLCPADTRAQKRSRAKRGAAAKAKPAEQPVSELARLRAQFVEATKEVKASLAQLLDLYEKDVKKADERVTQTLELYRAGLVSKRDLEGAEEAAAQARAKVAVAEGQLKNADVQIAETLIEAEAEEAAAKALTKARTAPRAVGGLLTTTAYIRFGGTRAWSLAEAGAVGQFYARSFGRQLPVSSFGQSPVHDRWGYAHHNAMDVGVVPDSVEGRALMEFLRGAGIPFTAFRYAIPGTATGPHIHIGRPSHKIAPR